MMLAMHVMTLCGSLGHVIMYLRPPLLQSPLQVEPFPFSSDFGEVEGSSVDRRMAWKFQRSVVRVVHWCIVEIVMELQHAHSLHFGFSLHSEDSQEQPATTTTTTMVVAHFILLSAKPVRCSRDSGRRRVPSLHRPTIATPGLG